MAQYDTIAVSKTSGNRLLLDQALAHVLDRKQSIYEAQHVTTMIGMVEADLGVAAVPWLAMPAHDHSLLVSVPLEEPVVTRQVGLIRGAEDHCRHRLSSFMIFCSRDQRFPR